MATWEKRESQSEKEEGLKKKRKQQHLRFSHRSASFPEKTEGLGNRAKGRTWT